jgi:hypothetical protein
LARGGIGWQNKAECEKPSSEETEETMTASVDERRPERRALDEQIAAEPPKPAPDLPPDAPSLPVEAYLADAS